MDQNVVPTEQNGSTWTVDSRQFLLDCLERMGLRASPMEADGYRLVPVSDDSDRAKASHVYSDWIDRAFTFDAPSADRHGIEPLVPGSRMWNWLATELNTRQWPLHAYPARQVTSVHELTGHLFAQYEVAQGRMHLSGCNLEDRPFLQLTYLDDRPSNRHPQLSHCLFGSDGKAVAPELARDLALDELAVYDGRTPRLAQKVVSNWTDVAQHYAQRNDRALAATLIWCKYASGQLTFSIGRQSVGVSFEGWAQLLATRRVVPPPFHCPWTNRSDYHLAATDDGRITVAPAIATCAVSGRRVLGTELDVCELTGTRALAEYLSECRASGRRLLSSQLKTCSSCRQLVSPEMLTADECRACRGVVRTMPTDALIADLMGRFPALQRWRRWKLAGAAAYSVLVASSTWKQLLIVVDKATGEPIYLATRSRLSSTWIPATDMQRAAWLGQPLSNSD